MMSDWTALDKNYHEKGAEGPLRFYNMILKYLQGLIRGQKLNQNKTMPRGSESVTVHTYGVHNNTFGASGHDYFLNLLTKECLMFIMCM